MIISDILSSIAWAVLALVYSYLDIFWHAVLVKFYGSQKNKIPPIKDQLLLESATSLAKKIRTQKITSYKVCRTYIDRIKEMNPILNAVVEHRFQGALEDAKKADEYVAKSGKNEDQLAREQPLLGVPFTVKNSIGIKGMIMDAAVVVRKGFKAKDDSDAVAHIRKAGAIPLAVTNVPEACMWNDASNQVYGRTKNPYDLTRMTGGSSGGEGALLASCGSILGLGNDIGGSIRIPAFNCGVFGHKPTKKIISNQGQYPSSYRTEQDNFNVTGPMCRYAEDLLPVYRILAGENASKLKLDQKVNMKDLKVYYTDDFPNGPFTVPIKEEMKESVYQAVNFLEKNFQIKAQRVSLPVPIHKWTSIWFSKVGSAKAPNLMEVVTESNTPLNLPVELIKWAFRISKHTLHMLSLFLVMGLSSNLEPEVIKKNNDLCFQLDVFFKQILSDDGIFLYPPQPEPAYYHQEEVLKFYTIGYTGMFNLLGYPVTQCPMGLNLQGLPLGVQVIATQHNDHLTLAVAKELEKGFGGWKSCAEIL